MSTGYGQIRLVEGSNGSQITSLLTKQGIFCWRVMPMGRDLMKEFLSRCQSGGVHLNTSKFNITLDGKLLIFAGIQVGSEGYSINPAHLDSICQSTGNCYEKITTTSSYGTTSRKRSLKPRDGPCQTGLKCCDPWIPPFQFDWWWILPRQLA